jgi:hypothetical protein
LNGHAAPEAGSPQEIPAGLNRRVKSWMVNNLPPQAVDRLRALNKVLRI